MGMKTVHAHFLSLFFFDYVAEIYYDCERGHTALCQGSSGRIPMLRSVYRHGRKYLRTDFGIQHHLQREARSGWCMAVHSKKILQKQGRYAETAP